MVYRIRGWFYLFGIVFLLTGCGAYFPALATRPVVKASQQDVLTRSGDPQKGRALFLGYQHLQNGGPACMGCHSVGNNGLLGGGALGPNLTDVTTRRSMAELVATLGNTDGTLSPVMKPVYAEEPLTAAEQADLIAFMTASAGEPESDYEWLLLVISFTGFFGVVVAIQLIYRKRLRGVRKPLVEKANALKR